MQCRNSVTCPGSSTVSLHVILPLAVSGERVLFNQRRLPPLLLSRLLPTTGVKLLSKQQPPGLLSFSGCCKVMDSSGISPWLTDEGFNCRILIWKISSGECADVVELGCQPVPPSIVIFNISRRQMAQRHPATHNW